MKVYIPEDALDPTNTEFMRDLEGFIEEVIKSTKGHCFLLFTSYYFFDIFSIILFVLYMIVI